MSFVNDEIISKVTLTDLHAFLAHCNTERGNSSVTRSRKASSLRGFFKYVSDRMGYIPNNPASQLQVAQKRKQLPKYLTLEQSIDLLNSVKGENRARDYCILTLFLNCGLRLAELVSLNLADFNILIISAYIQFYTDICVFTVKITFLRTFRLNFNTY